MKLVYVCPQSTLVYEPCTLIAGTESTCLAEEFALKGALHTDVR